MSRPIWKGNISFGLVNIPVALYSAENHSELQFHLLDSRNHARIHYERVNAETGKKVPWDKIVKAYEFDKGSYVIVDEKELEKTATENFQTVEIQEFIEQQTLQPIYFEKPYYLIPTKQGEKGYLLLHQTLKKTKKCGIVKVVIRTKQYLAALLPYENLLLLNLLRFDSETHKPEEFEIPKANTRKYNITPKEIHMAERLIESMSSEWKPNKYHNENKELLSTLINKKINNKKEIKTTTSAKIKSKSKDNLSTANVIDFMELLKKSIKEKKSAQSNKHKPKHKPKSLRKK